MYVRGALVLQFELLYSIWETLLHGPSDFEEIKIRNTQPSLFKLYDM